MSRHVAGGTRTRRDRRGATIVLVAILMLALVGMTAFAVDVSRMYVGANELQTVADASALRGAQRLQSNPGVDPSSEIIAFALANEALNGSVTLANSDIRPAIWTESSNTLDTSASVTWTTANSVQVTARRSAALLFGRVLRSVAPVPARRSAAWLANISRVDCIQPVGIPSSLVSAKLGQSVETPAGVAALRALLLTPDGPSQMTFIMGPAIGGPYQGTTNPPRDGDFFAITNQGSSPNGFESMVLGEECDNATSWSLGQVAVQPGAGNQVANRVDAFYNPLGPCQGTLALNAPVCRDKVTSSPGATMVIALLSNSAAIQMLVSFKLQCVFIGSGGNAFKNGNPSERCPYLQSSYFTTRGVPDSNYPGMTTVGHLQADFPVLGPGTGLGNVTSLSQRLILVK